MLLGNWEYGEYIDFDSVEFSHIRVGNGRLQAILRPVWPSGAEGQATSFIEFLIARGLAPPRC